MLFMRHHSPEGREPKNPDRHASRMNALRYPVLGRLLHNICYSTYLAILSLMEQVRRGYSLAAAECLQRQDVIAWLYSPGRT